ncbi:MAG TPA: hypothetical protein VF297_19840 [Pyrinomonadaceae bacterium]
MRIKLFLVGLAIGLTPFVAANVYGYLRMGSTGSAACNDCSVSFGFPFPLWVEGGFVSVKRVLWAGLLADVLIAVVAGVILGMILMTFSQARRRLR